MLLIKIHVTEIYLPSIKIKGTKIEIMQKPTK